MSRALGAFVLVWLGVLLILALVFGAWMFALFVLEYGLMAAAVQLPLLAGAYCLAGAWPGVPYRALVVALGCGWSVLLFVFGVTRPVIVPVVLAYGIYLFVARQPSTPWDVHRQSADACPLCGSPTAMARVEARPAAEGGGLRAVHLCVSDRHAGWRGVDGCGPLLPLEPV